MLGLLHHTNTRDPDWSCDFETPNTLQNHRVSALLRRAISDRASSHRERPPDLSRSEPRRAYGTNPISRWCRIASTRTSSRGTTKRYSAT